jgi:hypothetical protein
MRTLERPSRSIKFADDGFLKNYNSPLVIRKHCASFNNSKVKEILLTKKNNRKINYNIISENNRKMMNKTVDGSIFRGDFIKKVDES